MSTKYILNDDQEIVQQYAVETSVLDSTVVGGNARIYPAEIQTIAPNMHLSIEGIADKTVISVGNDAQGDYFTYAGTELPEPGAAVWTPWLYVGSTLYTRADGNAIELTYSGLDNSLYFATRKSPDSGSVHIYIDDEEIEGSPFDLYNETAINATILIKGNAAAGQHTLRIEAAIEDPAVFVYFRRFEMLEYIRETGGYYHFLGPAPASLETSTHNYVGDWSITPSSTYAYTDTPGDSVFFYAQLDQGGAIKFRAQKTPDSGIVEVYKDGDEDPVTEIDLYDDPASGPAEITLFENPPDDAADSIAIELRNKNAKNPLSGGHFFYFKGSAVYYSRSDAQALELVADYLWKVAELNGDGSFPDSVVSDRINFDSMALYACLGLLAAYEVIPKPQYLTVVKNYLSWFAGLQNSSPGSPFDDGYWTIGYQINPDPPPAYIPAISPYKAQGISEIRWVDAVQSLGCCVLWWYWKLSGDDATRDALLPTYQKGLDGLITNNYDAETGFIYSSWRYRTTPTMFLYHDSIRRYDSAGALVEEHDDVDTDFFTYKPAGEWHSYAPEGAVGHSEHYALLADTYFDFSLALNAGDEVRWVTQISPNVGIAEVLISDNGFSYSHQADVDGYVGSIQLQHEFSIYTATGTATKYFRIRHTGTINPAGQITPGWETLKARYSAGQTDVLLGLVGLWLMTRQAKYANLAVKILQRYPGRYWYDAGQRWYISISGNPPGNPGSTWYPFPAGYTPFGQKWSRLFTPTSLFAAGLQGLEQWFTSDPVTGEWDGGIQPPNYSEPQHIFSCYYVMGENQLDAPTDQAKYDAAKQFIKDGQYFLNFGPQPTGGIVFSKTYPYLYTTIAAKACWALAGTRIPFTEQLPVGQGVSRLVVPQYGERG